jgi:hypothetical protein
MNEQTERVRLVGQWVQKAENDLKNIVAIACRVRQAIRLHLPKEVVE